MKPWDERNIMLSITSLQGVSDSLYFENGHHSLMTTCQHLDDDFVLKQVTMLASYRGSIGVKGME
jgi:hypothetical protein